jgi:hypothetical protein
MSALYVRFAFCRQVTWEGLDCKHLIFYASGALRELRARVNLGGREAESAWKQPELPLRRITEGKMH